MKRIQLQELVFMKRILKSGLSVVLAFMVVFGSVCVGLGEFYCDSPFSVKAKATVYASNFTPTYSLSYKLNSTGDGYIVTNGGDFGSEVVIPETYNSKPVKEIGVQIMSTERISTLYIPSSVEKITLGTHTYSSLKSITVNPNNKYFSSADGVLFNKNKSELLMYPGEKENNSYTIPSTVSKIHEDAFTGSNFESVVLPSSITTVGGYAFSYCQNLKSVTIPDSVKVIPEGCFYKCYRLTSVTLPANLTRIEKIAFVNCNYLKSIKVPETVTYIGKMALGYISDPGGDTKISGFTIYGKSGTAAETYAKREGFKFVNNSGTLNTPKLVSISNVNSGLYIKWNVVSGASGYYVYRKVGNSGWVKIATVSDGSKYSYTDTTVKSGYNYKYTVRAYKGSTLSSYNSNGLSAKRLTTPKLVSVSNLNNGIYLKWNSVYGASGYQVYRKVGNGGWVKIATISGNSKVSYSDATVKAGYNYKYTVRAYFGSSLSYYNTTGLAIKRLIAPKLTGVTSAKAGVTVKWNKTYGATGYQVYRKTGNGGWVKIATVSGGSKVSYLDKTAKKGVTYTYTVRAYYGSSLSYYNTTGLKITDRY